MSEDPQKFLIVGPWRSGTKYTWNALQMHGDVTIAEQEVTPWPLFTLGLGVFTDFHGGFDMRRAFVRGAFDLLCANAQPVKTPVLGGKTALRDDHEARDVVVGLQQYLEDLSLIIVQRNDLVARFASVLLATGTGRWHVEGTDVPAAGSRQSLPATAFRRFVEETRASEAALSLLSQTHQVTCVDYERDIRDGCGVDHVFAPLGLEPHNLPSQVGKTTAPIDEWVENVPELRRIEAETPRPDRARAEQDLAEHTQHLYAAEPYYLLLGRARYLQRAKRFREAFDQTLSALRKLVGPVNGAHCRALRIMKWAFRQEHDISSEQMAAALDELRSSFDGRAEFYELEAEHALRENDVERGLLMVRRAREAGPDCETLHRLDALERRLQG